MKYRELKEKLNSLSEEQLEMDVTVYKDDEYFALNSFHIESEDDVLDAGHPVLSKTLNGANQAMSLLKMYPTLNRIIAKNDKTTFYPEQNDKSIKWELVDSIEKAEKFMSRYGYGTSFIQALEKGQKPGTEIYVLLVGEEPKVAAEFKNGKLIQTLHVKGGSISKYQPYLDKLIAFV